MREKADNKQKVKQMQQQIQTRVNDVIGFLMYFEDLFFIGGFMAKWGRDGAMFTHNKLTRFYFGFFTSVLILVKIHQENASVRVCRLKGRQTALT